MSVSPTDESGLLSGVRSGDAVALLAWADAWEEHGWNAGPLRQLPPLLAAIRKARTVYENRGGVPPGLPLCLYSEGWHWGGFPQGFGPGIVWPTLPPLVVPDACPDGPPWIEEGDERLRGHSATVGWLLRHWNRFHPAAEWLFRNLGLTRCVFRLTNALQRERVQTFSDRHHLRPLPIGYPIWQMLARLPRQQP
jgi:hypothetical protein